MIFLIHCIAPNLSLSLSLSLSLCGCVHFGIVMSGAFRTLTPSRSRPFFSRYIGWRRMGGMHCAVRPPRNTVAQSLPSVSYCFPVCSRSRALRGSWLRHRVPRCLNAAGGVISLWLNPHYFSIFLSTTSSKNANEFRGLCSFCSRFRCSPRPFSLVTLIGSMCSDS